MLNNERGSTCVSIGNWDFLLDFIKNRIGNEIPIDSYCIPIKNFNFPIDTCVLFFSYGNYFPLNEIQ